MNLALLSRATLRSTLRITNLQIRSGSSVRTKILPSETRDLIGEIQEQLKDDPTFAQGLSQSLNQEEREALLKELRRGEPEPENPHSVLPLTRQQLYYHSIRNGVPFIGFGFLDNAIMIIAGEYIDTTLGVTLGISTMAAAGIGNWVSDIAGLGIGGWIEASANKLRIPDPKLSWEQSETRNARIAKSTGTMVGITIGCFLGLTPLLFY